MRIEGIKKLGFYALPPQTTALIAANLTINKRDDLKMFSLLDPCCGNGIPLRTFAETLRAQKIGVVTYGSEVSPDRAAAAKSMLDHVLADDYKNVQASNETFSLLYLNPPYDWEGKREDDERQDRQEYIFLRDTLPRLQMGGLLVYIIPHQTLGEVKLRRFLAGHFSELQVYAFPPEEYEQFKQLVIVGYRRKLDRHNDLEETLTYLAKYVDEMPPALTAETPWLLPPSKRPAEEISFYRFNLTRQELLATVGEHGLFSRPEWKQGRLEQIQAEDIEFQPAVPMRPGHISMLLLSGLLQTMILDQGRLMVKGRVEKVEVTEERSEDETAITEQFVTKIFVLHDDGRYQVIDDEAGFQSFMFRYSADMASILEKRFTPLYQSPTQAEWDALAPLLLTKKLPGAQTVGLLDAQKHMVIAASRVLKKHKTATIVAEMGWGKSSCSASVLHLLDAYPAILIGPPHLTEKWADEFRDTVPDIMPVIVTNIVELRGVYDEYERKKRDGEPLPKLVVILSLQDGKKGSGWRIAHTHRKRYQRGRPLQGQEKGKVAIHTYPVTCPDCNHYPLDKDDLPMGRLPTNKKMRCHCGGVFWQYYHRFNPELQRWPVARYIRTQLPRGWFKLLIADEVHDYKAGDTDQAQAYADLVSAARMNLNLTGTWFGGKSKSIFYLMYRTVPRVRQEFGFKEEEAWSQKFGRVETVIKYRDEYVNGAFTGNRRSSVQVRELPGINPAIVPYMLPTVLFASIQDLGYELPAYQEEIVRIPMSSAQQDEYEEYSNDLLDEFQKAPPREKAGWISVWQQTCLGRPDSIHREDKILVLSDEDVSVVKKKNGKLAGYREFRVLPPLLGPGDLAPKEEWLLDTIADEVRQDRKALVYLRQTGTRDIQPRLLSILDRYGYRAQLIPDKVKPKDRAGWIRDNAKLLDCLPVNARKVATGLDLVMFSTVIVYEIEYSLTILWQSIRRVWRLGQIHPVRVLFGVYEGTLEEAALTLMGQKMRAAYNIYGSVASSALADEDDGDNILDQLTRHLLKHGKLEVEGFTGLIKQQEAQVSTWARRTAPTPAREMIIDGVAHHLDDADLVLPPSVPQPTVEIIPTTTIDDIPELFSDWTERLEKPNPLKRKPARPRLNIKRKSSEDLQLTLF